MWWRLLDCLRYFVIVPLSKTHEGLPKFIIFEGGPLDGKTWADLDEDEAHILMSDGQRHRYVRTVEFQEATDGSLVQVFRWAGRHFGAE